MNSMSFVIMKNEKKTAVIEAENFKSAIRQFAEMYDMPDAESGNGTDENIFLAVHGETKIQFKYVYRNASYVEYRWDGIIELVKIEKIRSKN